MKSAIEIIRDAYITAARGPWKSIKNLGDYILIRPTNEQIDIITTARFETSFRNRLGGRKFRVIQSGEVGGNQVPLVMAGLDVPQTFKLASQKLDLSQQPSPLHVPIGNTKTGPLWLPLGDIDCALVAGPRGTGKTNLLHGWIQALIHGEQAELFLWDGKYGAEFSRYESLPIVTYDDDLALVFEALSESRERRERLLGEYRHYGYNSIKMVNERIAQPVPPAVMVIDEIAIVDQSVLNDLKEYLATSRYLGISIVAGTQRATKDELPLFAKSNLTTRIAFSVASWADSRAILGETGAERLPKTPGRIMLKLGNRKIVAQAYEVELNAPFGVKMTKTQHGTSIREPRGIDRRLLEAALANGGKIPQAAVMSWGDMTQAQARGWQLRAVEYGWLQKDSKQKNSYVLSEAALELLGETDLWKL